VKELHGLHQSTGEIALSAHKVSILKVYRCGKTVPGSHHSREFFPNGMPWAAYFWRSKSLGSKRQVGHLSSVVIYQIKTPDELKNVQVSHHIL
jgi:hypothetical protein